MGIVLKAKVSRKTSALEILNFPVHKYVTSHLLDSFHFSHQNFYFQGVKLAFILLTVFKIFAQFDLILKNFLNWDFELSVDIM